MKLSYHYNPKTFLFDETCETPIDPLETQIVGHEVWMLGADCTFKKPPENKDGYNIVFNPEEDEWEYQKVNNTESIENISTESEIAQNRIAELESYLSSTDWYAIRFVETGAEIPNDVKQQRQSAREEISRLRELLKNDEKSQDVQKTSENLESSSKDGSESED